MGLACECVFSFPLHYLSRLDIPDSVHFMF